MIQQHDGQNIQDKKENLSKPNLSLFSLPPERASQSSSESCSVFFSPCQRFFGPSPMLRCGQKAYSHQTTVAFAICGIRQLILLFFHSPLSSPTCPRKGSENTRAPGLA